METRSNHVLVGSVVLALLAGLLLFVVWLAGLSRTPASNASTSISSRASAV